MPEQPAADRCPLCNNEGLDSGGVNPDGSPINFPCPMCELTATVARLERERDQLREDFAGLAEAWRDDAANAREEAACINRTIKAVTDAEERCKVRAEVYDECAAEIDAALRKETSR